MVKGLSRQVIVVKSPDPEYFEQAIFILRDDALQKEGMTERSVLRQAKQVAMGCIGARPKKPPYRQLAWAAMGALAVGLLWAVSLML